MGVGLGSGLLILAATWAAIFSGGRSAFTPVAIAFALAIGIAALARRGNGSQAPSSNTSPMPTDDADGPRDRWSIVRAVLAGGAFVVLVGLLYGSTMAPSPRDNLQPLEFRDEAYYAVLGRDLAQTGTETVYSPSGFDVLPGLPVQTWYHWGEAWLAAFVITLAGLDPMFARYYVVLPLLMLAASALTGTLVRRMAGTSSRRAFLFGAAASLFLAPVPFAVTFFAYWPRGLIFGITQYGVAAIAVLLVLYILTLRRSVRPSTAVCVFAGSVIASTIPAHIVIAIVGLVGVGGAVAMRWILSYRRNGRSAAWVPHAWQGLAAAAGSLIIATVVWGTVTGHGIGASGLSSSVSPFNESWRWSVALTTLGSGVFLAIPVAWFLVRNTPGPGAWVFLGTLILLVAGAIGWGARLGDFNTFHVFYGAIAVFATPVAAVAAWMLWERLRQTGHLRLAAGVVALCIAQLELGLAGGVLRLQEFGPRTYQPTSTTLLAAIRQLPKDAKLAYACPPVDEVAFWVSNLISIDAHTGKRVVPMCFQAEYFGFLTGTPMSPEIESPYFQLAPQRAIYPDADARPSSARVAAFLKGNGIDYIYADTQHPNSLVPDAILVSSSGDEQLLQIP